MIESASVPADDATFDATQLWQPGLGVLLGEICSATVVAMASGCKVRRAVSRSAGLTSLFVDTKAECAPISTDIGTSVSFGANRSRCALFCLFCLAEGEWPDL